MATPSPRVSIVLPVYNGSKLFRRSIDSCLKQTYKDFELILVDDCSTDSTPEIIRSYKDPRIRYFRNEKNQRLPKSLNIGFMRATGEYLTWTSDDNEYEPEAIETMLDCLLKNPGTDFVYADFWAYYEESDKKELIRLDNLDLKVRNRIGGAFLYTRKVYETIGGYNSNYEMVEDYDYWIRIFKRFKTIHSAEAHYLYRYHTQSLTTTRLNNQDLFDIILKYRNGYAPLSKLGWTAAYYFDNVMKSNKPAREKRKLFFHTLAKIAGLSFPFFLLFIFLMFHYSVYKKLRSFLTHLSILKPNHRSLS